MRKKALVSPVFTYIFALVAGVIILAFFLSFAMKHKGTATALEVREFAFGFDDSLTAFSALGIGQKDFLFPFDTDVFLTPGSIGVGSGTENFSKATRSIVFSPQRLFGKSIAAWTIRWRLPFSVANFFFLTNDRYRYFIVYNPVHLDYVENFLKDEVPEMVKPVNKFIGSNQIGVLKTAIKAFPPSTADIRFLLIGSVNVANIESVVKDTVFKDKYSIVTVEPFEKTDGQFDYEFGEVKFLDSGEERLYIGKAMMYGAMFAEDVEAYDYGYWQAMGRLVNMTEMYKKKVPYVIGPSCDPPMYSQLQILLSSMQHIAATGSSSADDFRNVVVGVENGNKAVMGEGCTALF